MAEHVVGAAPVRNKRSSAGGGGSAPKESRVEPLPSSVNVALTHLSESEEAIDAAMDQEEGVAAAALEDEAGAFARRQGGARGTRRTYRGKSRLDALE